MDIIEKPDLPGFRTDNRSTQTRFHFHMDLCVGCHACEVACSEQNGLPVDTQWRRVGEVEGGEYPDTLRFFLSSGCNHCLDAPCAKGCPVDAYKIDERGIVIHQADVCIGCQYCTWNCPYSVPSFQPERGVVSKCDMCVNRLEEGREPACAQACPAGAIEIETVPLEEVLATYEDAGAAPGMPAPEISMPSTKITLPEGVDPSSLHPVTDDFVEPEEPHSPLIFMTVLTQIGLGGFAAIYAVDLLRSLSGAVPLAGTALGTLAAVLMGVIGLSLTASTLHLGRPAFAFRAIRNWRTSWLSREVLALSLFAKVAFAYAAFLLTTEGLGWVSAEALGGVGARLSLGAVAVTAGIAGIYASARLYRVPARPAWNFRKTTVDFFAVAWIVGPAVLALALVLGGEAGWSVQASALASALALLAYAKLHSDFVCHLAESETFELKASAELYRDHFAHLRMYKNGAALLALMGLLALGGGVVSIAAATVGVAGLVAYVFLQRYLFFTTVVGTNIAGNFIVEAHRSVARRG